MATLNKHIFLGSSLRGSVHSVRLITDLTNCFGYPLRVNISVAVRSDLVLAVGSVDREMALLVSPLRMDLSEAI